MKLIVNIFLLCFVISHSAFAQYSVKVKKEDNRLIFHNVYGKSDTLIKNKSDLFYIKFPDNNKGEIQIFLSNGQFVKTDNDTIYKLISVTGMKYSHSKPDSTFNTLVEGICNPSKTIQVDFVNTFSKQKILERHFIVK